jgi:hypothetical protein
VDNSVPGKASVTNEDVKSTTESFYRGVYTALREIFCSNVSDDCDTAIASRIADKICCSFCCGCVEVRDADIGAMVSE